LEKFDVSNCPKCSGEMKEGDALVRFTTPSNPGGATFGMPNMPGMSLPTEIAKQESILWKEKTGQKKGWLVKRDETKILKLSGKRCQQCGYVELFARE
jgi:hypothetical protein